MKGESDGGAGAPGPRKRRFARIAVAVAWLLAAGAGLFVLERYAATPGAEAGVPAAWPAASSLRAPAGRPMLLLFLHPECPCSRATLSELERLLAAARREVEVVALLSAPGEALVARVSSIPGVRVARDRLGEEARRFGATTSGHALLYGPRGELLYRGGITRARGHEGDNSGSEAILAHLRGERGGARGPVYGCPLRRPGSEGANDG